MLTPTFKLFLLTVLLAAGLATCSTDTLGAQQKPNERPNIVWILVDDFGWRDLGCYDSPLYETPNIDRLASQSARFTQAYSIYPRCVPSRFGMLTGKHPARFQGRSDGVKIEPGRDRTIGSVFADNGYNTFYCGKWHLGDGAHSPANNGFETSVAAGAAGATSSHFAPYNRVRWAGHTVKEAIEGLDDAPEGEYLADRLTDETIKFLRRQSADRPFFAVLAHYAVHTPLEAKQDLTDHYQHKLDGMPQPEVVLEPESAGENQLVQNNPVYAGMIDSVDQGVGRILKCLDQQGLSDSTIVVLTSDHGGLSARGNNRPLATSNRPLRAGKGHLYEGGLRIPLIVRWPGVTQAGSELSSPVVGIDFFPTLLEMAGLPADPSSTIDGQSFVAALRGDEINRDRAFYWHNPAPRPASTGDWFSSAMRVGDWKLIEFPESKRIELYNLADDMGEAHNLATDEANKASELHQQLASWKNQVQAADPKPNRQRNQAARQRQSAT